MPANEAGKDKYMCKLLYKFEFGIPNLGGEIVMKVHNFGILECIQ
jgi:hypothetical protein